MASYFSPTQEELTLVSQIFTVTDPARRGVVEGDAGFRVFRQCKLSTLVLSQIWDIVDTQRRGCLSSDEVAMAVRLIGWAQTGERVDRALLNRPGPLAWIRGLSNQALTDDVTSKTSPLSNEDRKKYQAIFEAASPSDGLLSGTVARDLFLKSQLPTEVLADFWEQTDPSGRGSLTITDFVLGMHLITTELTRRANLISSPFRDLAVSSPPPIPDRPYARSSVTPLPPSRMPTPPPSFASALKDERISERSHPPVPFDLSPEERAIADKHFDALDSAKQGFIDGHIAANFMLKSKLPAEELSLIWDLSDTQKIGQLRREDFMLAVCLIKRRKLGIPIPDTLPPFKIPPYEVEENAARSVPSSSLPSTYQGTTSRDGHHTRSLQADSTPISPTFLSAESLSSNAATTSRNTSPAPPFSSSDIQKSSPRRSSLSKSRSMLFNEASSSQLSSPFSTTSDQRPSPNISTSINSSPRPPPSPLLNGKASFSRRESVSTNRSNVLKNETPSISSSSSAIPLSSSLERPVASSSTSGPLSPQASSPDKPSAHLKLENERLWASLSELTEQLKAQRERTAELLLEKASLKSQLQDMEHSLSDVLAASTARQEQQHEDSQQQDEAKVTQSAEIERLSLQVAMHEVARDQHAQTRRLLDDVAQENSTLRMRVEELTKAEESAASEGSEMRRQVQVLLDENDDLKRKVGEMSDAIMARGEAAASRSGQGSGKGVAELEILLGDVTRENEELKRQVRGMETAMGEMLVAEGEAKERMHELNRQQRSMMAFIQTLETTVHTSSQEREDLKRALRAAQEQQAQLETHAREAGDAARRYRQRAEAAREASNRVEELQRENAALRTQLAVATSVPAQNDEGDDLPPPAYDDGVGASDAAVVEGTRQSSRSSRTTRQARRPARP